jgi:hypothetical protein
MTKAIWCWACGETTVPGVCRGVPPVCAAASRGDEQEASPPPAPVAWLEVANRTHGRTGAIGLEGGWWELPNGRHPLYTTPRAAEGASAPPLTDDEIWELWLVHGSLSTADVIAFGRAIEAALSPPKKEGM